MSSSKAVLNDRCELPCELLQAARVDAIRRPVSLPILPYSKTPSLRLAEIEDEDEYEVPR
jgi:hypothetical protein